MSSKDVDKMSECEPPHDKTNKLTVHPAKTRSAWVSAQSDQSLLCAQWVAKDPSFIHVDSEDWSDWADAQADPSLRWVHSHIGFVLGGLCVHLNLHCLPRYVLVCPKTSDHYGTKNYTGTALGFMSHSTIFQSYLCLDVWSAQCLLFYSAALLMYQVLDTLLLQHCIRETPLSIGYLIIREI